MKKVFFLTIFLICLSSFVYGVTVAYSPQNINCGTTTITATFSCSFSGNVLVTTTNTGVTIGSTGIMAVVNGVGTIPITLTTAAPNPVTIRVTVLTTNNTGCAAVNDFAINTISHTCVLPTNDDCNGATSLTVNVPNCSPLPYTATNATNQSGYTTCGPFAYRDVWFSFTAVNTTITMSLGAIPGDFLYYSLFANCSSNSYLACNLILENGTANFTSLTVGQIYKIRLSLVSPDAGNVNICLKATSVLPVELKYFTLINSTQEYAELAWETASEVNLKEFIVQKSNDGQSFTDIASIKALSAFGAKYEYMDTWMSKINYLYYRLKMLDYDGQYEFGPMLVIKPIFDQKLKVFPVPSSEYIDVSIPSALIDFEKKTIAIVDINGKEIYRQTFNKDTLTNVRIDVSQFDKGTYFLHFLSGDIKEWVQWTKW